MSEPSARVPVAWIVAAHALGAAAIGAMDAARLGSRPLAMVVIPLFALTGVLAGLVIAGTEGAVARRARWPWWLAAVGRAAPSLLVSVPVASTLFQGAFAQTLPMARVLPVVAPLVIWLGVALVIAGGHRLLAGRDLTSRGIAILGCAMAIGGLVWTERHLLKTGYPGAHVGATLAVAVIAGCALRVGHAGNLSPYLAATVVALALGTSVAATLHGLTAASDRRLLATYGDQGRDLVGLWRRVLDRDRDGSSPVLGGGDCDDGDPTRHPGAPDPPGDGIDQDCDGEDFRPPEAAAPPPRALDLASWRATPAVQGVLARTKDMNVLVITVDALRFDMLAPDAVDRAEFPHLTQLLDASVWFTRAFAPASGTDVSLGTLLTGRFDPYQRIQTTLPEALRELGRRTYSALPVEVTRYVGDTLPARGFDRARPVHTDWNTDDVGDHVSAPTTSLEGTRALDDAAARPWFVWLHYFDVHEHHQIDVPHELLAAVHDDGSRKRHGYRALLLAIDREVGHLQDELTRRGLADRTIIVFASDHGESLGEDPRLLETHGKVAYAPLVRIPFSIHVPGVPGGQRTDAASVLDLAPTLLSLLDAPHAMGPLDGLDLVPAMLDAPAALRHTGRALVIHEELQWSVVEWPHQLLVRPAENLVELYDLEKDPEEREDLSTRAPEVVSRLRARYAEVPQVRVDRTPDGRRWREQQAQPLQPHGPGAGSAATSRP